MVDFFNKYGPVANMRILWSDLVFTTSPEHIKLILATDFQNYVKGKSFGFDPIWHSSYAVSGERFHKTMFSVLGSGVFNSDGMLILNLCCDVSSHKHDL